MSQPQDRDTPVMDIEAPSSRKFVFPFGPPKKIDWDTRHCARYGHTTFLPTESHLAELIAIDTPAGPATRCLRCGNYIVGAVSITGPAADAPEVHRGRALRDLFIMRLLAIDRGVKGLGLAAAAIAVVIFHSSQKNFGLLAAQDIPVIRQATIQLGWNIDSNFLLHQAHVLAAIAPATLVLTSAGLFLYAAIELAEGVGLWLAKRWGEYLAVIASSIFLPLEIWEIADHATPVKVVVLVLNIAAVIWLVVTKRLFGVRGGHAASKTALRSESILAVQQKSTANTQPHVQ